MRIPHRSYAITATMLLAMAGASVAAMAEDTPIYSLNLSTGTFPANVKYENANGQLPDKEGYKRGFTEKGWTVGRLDDRGYVALSPTYTGDENSCENILTLPDIQIDGHSVIKWQSKSVYRHFPECYRLEAISDGEEAKILFSSEKESYFWNSNEVSLNAYQGKNVSLRFVCTSSKGYMLALSGINISEGEAAQQQEEESYSASRRLVVDRGTGTWCVNCPAADVDVESLIEKYGDRVISLNTHVNDVLANEAYWKTLDWYSIPRLMLNRIKATEGSDTKKFSTYIDQPTPFSISLTTLERQEEKINCSAKIRVGEDIEGNYSVGYVLTGDFHDPDNAAYAQRNNCTQPFYGAYYYLPSTIPSALMYYDDVTLTFDGAFSGLEGSTTIPLASALTTGNEYDVEWNIPVPELVNSVNALKVVAYVMDSVTGEIMNADEATIGDLTGIPYPDVEDVILSRLSVDSEGVVSVSLAEGTPYSLKIFSMQGVNVYEKEMIADGFDRIQPELPAGLYIIQLSTSDVNESLKAMIR